MLQKRSPIGIKSLIIGLYLLLQYACIEPVPAIFDYKEDLIIIDAVASTVPGTTFATVKKTFIEYGQYKSEFLTGCTVSLINSDTQEVIPFFEGSNSYLVSPDFKITSGSRWELEITTLEGKTFKSFSETTPDEVRIESVFEIYNKEMSFNEGLGKYIPGHEIRVDFQEPEDQKNFYYFQYRAYEKEIYCKLCNYGVLRNGECLSQINNPQAKDYYTYLCDQTCWKVSYNQEISLFDDAFTNGKMISNLLVGRVPLNSKQAVLVEILQLNITEEAHKYYKTLKDIVDNNSGFNAPLPSALIGNFYNPFDDEDPILGRFTAAAGNNKSLFIERGSIPQRALGEYKPSVPELLGDPLPNPITYESPCIEGRFRTTIKPSRWEE